MIHAMDVIDKFEHTFLHTMVDYNREMLSTPVASSASRDPVVMYLIELALNSTTLALEVYSYVVR